MKKCLSIALAVIMLLCLLPTTTALASYVAAVDIKDIDLPVAGAKPDLSAELGSLSDVMKITLVEWTEYDEGWEWQRDMTANDTFIEGYWYVVYVHVEANLGHSFFNSVTGTINGESTKISGNAVQDNGKKVCFYKSYQATRLLTPITFVELNVVNPVIGKTPTFAKVDTKEYFSEKQGTVSNCTNGVTWTNESSGVNLTVSNPFKANTDYTVSYYLTAKDGYKFTRNTVCSINGYLAVMTPVDHFHIIVSLSNLKAGDGKKEITTLDLSVKAPKEDERPEFTKIDGNGYYSDNGSIGTSSQTYKNGIAWYETETYYLRPDTTDSFVGGKEYTLKIMLTAKDGYKFSETLQAQVNGVSASVEYLEDGSVCVSVKLTATKKEHTHTPSDWRTNQVYHYKACTTCGDMLEQDDHSGGKATCSAKGKCSVCGYAYVEKNEEHTPDTSVWTACGNLYHAHLCKDCGAHVVTEEHKAGPAATETSPQKCTVCDYIIAPAKNHTHNLTKVEGVDPTCTELGKKEHYVCDGCSDLFEDAEGETQIPDVGIAPLGHKVSDQWRYDENNHWRICSVCEEELSETKMAHGMDKGTCTTCGFAHEASENTSSDPSDPSDASVDTSDSEEQNDGKGGMPWWGFVLIGVAAAAVGVVVCIVVMKKKK